MSTSRPSGASVEASEPAHEPGHEPTVLRARSLPELVGLVPVLLGFHPEESLVAICAHGPRQRLGLTIRVDLPPPDRPGDVAAVVEEVSRHVVAQQPAGVLLVLHTREGTRAVPVLAATVSAVEEAGVAVLEAARTDGERVWSLSCPDEACCPVGGTPFDAVASPLLAEAVLDGREVLPDRDALVRRLDPLPPDAAVEAATAEVVAEVARLGAGLLRPDADLEVVRTGWAASTEALDRVLAAGAGPGRTGGPAAADVAVLSVWSGSRTVRDLLWVEVTRETAREQGVAWREVARRATPAHRAGALCLAGFATWLQGDGALAATALEQALELEPDHSMARSVLTAVRGAVDPRRWPALPLASVVRTVPGLEPVRPVPSGPDGAL